MHSGPENATSFMVIVTVSDPAVADPVAASAGPVRQKAVADATTFATSAGPLLARTGGTWTSSSLMLWDDPSTHAGIISRGRTS